MSTPYKMMRCRMKDLISCFNACKLPIDDDDDDNQQPNPSSTGDDWKQQIDKQVESGRTPERGGGDESPAKWQSCEAEEDEYIVFYFKDDNTSAGVIEERVFESSSRLKQVVGARRKKHETRKIQVDIKSVPLETEDLNECQEHIYRQGESSDSSTSSFAFPTVHREWPGSPVLMPRPEGGQKSRSVCVQCCKF